MYNKIDNLDYTQFLKPIERTVTMTNGHWGVIFEDDFRIEMMDNKKRGPVIPRRKRAFYRNKGYIR